jgi:ABC-type transport system involved in cytochrome bd biosynthesis fused ATPase/permease subunit
MWFMEFTAVEEFDDEELLRGGNFHDQMMDYFLHVGPFVFLMLEFMTNSMPFIDRHYWYVTMPTLVAALVSTLMLEHHYGIKLYMVDLGFPYYNLSMIILSILFFYIMKASSYAKLKIQGFPCNKILEEMQEYWDHQERHQWEQEQNEAMTKQMLENPQAEKDFERESRSDIEMQKKRTMVKKDLSAIKEESNSSPMNRGTD